MLRTRVLQMIPSHMLRTLPTSKSPTFFSPLDFSPLEPLVLTHSVPSPKAACDEAPQLLLSPFLHVDTCFQAAFSLEVSATLRLSLSSYSRIPLGWCRSRRRREGKGETPRKWEPGPRKDSEAQGPITLLTILPSLVPEPLAAGRTETSSGAPFHPHSPPQLSARTASRQQVPRRTLCVPLNVWKNSPA